MNKILKSLTLVLGIFMLLTGVLKFVNPFKTWYKMQIKLSELPFNELSYWSGQLGEILIGALLLLLIYNWNCFGSFRFKISFAVINIIVLIMMVVALYVHLHPKVPNEVLPLKIKPPFIPLIFAVMSIVNVFSALKITRDDKGAN